MSQKKLIHVFVSGRVQGVGFRYHTQRLAKSHGLTGEVRNLGDGRVEIYAEGEESVLKKFLTQLEKGPNAFAHVSDLQVGWSDSPGHYNDFSISY